MAPCEIGMMLVRDHISSAKLLTSVQSIYVPGRVDGVSMLNVGWRARQAYGANFLFGVELLFKLVRTLMAFLQ